MGINSLSRTNRGFGKKSTCLLGERASHVDRDRSRHLRSQASPIAEEMGPITLKDSTVLQAPSDDENTPGLPSGALSSHPSFGPIEYSSDADGAPGWPNADKNAWRFG